MPRPHLGRLVDLGISDECLVARPLDGGELDGVVKVRRDEPAHEAIQPRCCAALSGVLQHRDHTCNRALLGEIADLDALAPTGFGELQD